MNYIRAITATMVAAIAVFKVGDFTQARTNSSYYSNDERYLSELVQLVFRASNDDNLEFFELNWQATIEVSIDDTNNLEPEFFGLITQVTTQQQRQKKTPTNLILLLLILSPMLWIFFSKKKSKIHPYKPMITQEVGSEE